MLPGWSTGSSPEVSRTSSRTSATLATLPTLRYSDIDFGYASAEKESAEAPDLLVKGFFDLDGIREKLAGGSPFLCLGYKGSGKSAIAEHFRLTADADTHSFVRRLYLADFPFTDFGQIMRGSQDVKARYPATWAWLLLLQVIDSLARDAAASSLDAQSFDRTLKLLRDMGFLPTPALHEIVLKSRDRNFRMGLGKVMEGGVKGSYAATGDVNFLTLVDILRNITQGVRSENSHLLLLDGLDDILLREPVQYETLAALVTETDRLNSAFRDAGAPVKIIVLCRTDIYNRLPGPNLNKVRRDSAIELDWYSDPKHPERSTLVKLANAKGRVSDSRLTDIFGAFFPSHLLTKANRIPIQRFLLERTRHVPRDFLQLLKFIQEAGRLHKGRLTEEMVRAGARQYSQRYFISEIRDELAGHLDQAQRDSAFETLGRLSSSRFTLNDFENLSKGAAVEFDPMEFLKDLYDCGAIGTQESGYLTFRYRNPHVPFNPRDRILLHRALAPALNVPVFAARS